MLFLLIEGKDCDGGRVSDLDLFLGDDALTAAWTRWDEIADTADSPLCPVVFDQRGNTYDRVGKTHHAPDQALADVAEDHLAGEAKACSR
jgi:hypothetical protein